MGGLDALSVLLWSPIYIGLLLLIVGIVGLLLRGLAPVGFRRVGILGGVTGTAGVLMWAVAMTLLREGTEWLQPACVAAYFAVLVAVLLCLPVAVVLANVGRYHLEWFVGLASLTILAVTLLAELVIGPAPVNGWNRWLSSLVPIVVFCGGGLVAFAIGARIPFGKSEKEKSGSHKSGSGL